NAKIRIGRAVVPAVVSGNSAGEATGQSDRIDSFRRAIIPNAVRSAIEIEVMEQGFGLTRRHIAEEGYGLLGSHAVLKGLAGSGNKRFVTAGRNAVWIRSQRACDFRTNGDAEAILTDGGTD